MIFLFLAFASPKLWILKAQIFKETAIDKQNPTIPMSKTSEFIFAPSIKNNKELVIFVIVFNYKEQTALNS